MLKPFKYVNSAGKVQINLRGIARVLCMLIRGFVASVRLRRPVLLGRGARLEHVCDVRGQGVLKVEEHVTIQGVSSRCVTLGRGVSFGAFSQLRPSSQYGGLVGEGCNIGDGSTFGPYAYIGCAGFIEIGRDCMFGPRVSLIAENHRIPVDGQALKGAGVTRLGIRIGNDCWIGANTVILDGARIGEGSIIGAGAVVRGVIPPSSIAVGVPARVIKSR
jgi:acetyltransferase-like isoleucine patch superfamily enzyme